MKFTEMQGCGNGISFVDNTEELEIEKPGPYAERHEKYDYKNDRVYMTGPAVTVFEGRLTK